jgi:hypothetical protein
MERASERNLSRKVDWNRLPETGIPGYEEASLPEQVVLLSRRIEKKPMSKIHTVWERLDDWARAIVMWHLGCFAGENSPQVIYARREQSVRESLAEVISRIRCLSKVIKRHADQMQTVAGLKIRDGKLHFITRQRPGQPSPALMEELTILRDQAANLKSRLPPRGKWNAKRMIVAQEFVCRRASVLGLPDSVSLSPEAIADVYELTRALADGSGEPESPENIRKAIANFRKSAANRASLARMDSQITNWANRAVFTLPGNSAFKKQGS